MVCQTKDQKRKSKSSNERASSSRKITDCGAKLTLQLEDPILGEDGQPTETFTWACVAVNPVHTGHEQLRAPVKLADVEESVKQTINLQISSNVATDIILGVLRELNLEVRAVAIRAEKAAFANLRNSSIPEELYKHKSMLFSELWKQLKPSAQEAVNEDARELTEALRNNCAVILQVARSAERLATTELGSVALIPIPSSDKILVRAVGDPQRTYGPDCLPPLACSALDIFRYLSADDSSLMAPEFIEEVYLAGHGPMSRELLGQYMEVGDMYRHTAEERAGILKHVKDELERASCIFSINELIENNFSQAFTACTPSNEHNSDESGKIGCYVFAGMDSWMASFALNPYVLTVDTVVKIRSDNKPVIDFLGRGCTGQTIPCAAGVVVDQQTSSFMWTYEVGLRHLYGRLLSSTQFSASDGDQCLQAAQEGLSAWAEFTVGLCSFHKLFLWLVKTGMPKAGIGKPSDELADTLIIALRAIRDEPQSLQEAQAAIHRLAELVKAGASPENYDERPVLPGLEMYSTDYLKKVSTVIDNLKADAHKWSHGGLKEAFRYHCTTTSANENMHKHFRKPDNIHSKTKPAVTVRRIITCMRQLAERFQEQLHVATHTLPAACNPELKSMHLIYPKAAIDELFRNFKAARSLTVSDDPDSPEITVTEPEDRLAHALSASLAKQLKKPLSSRSRWTGLGDNIPRLGRVLDYLLPNNVFKVTITSGYMSCSCGGWESNGVACAHLLAVRGGLCPEEDLSDFLRMDFAHLPMVYLSARLATPYSPFPPRALEPVIRLLPDATPSGGSVMYGERAGPSITSSEVDHNFDLSYEEGVDGRDVDGLCHDHSAGVDSTDTVVMEGEEVTAMSSRSLYLMLKEPVGGLISTIVAVGNDNSQANALIAQHSNDLLEALRRRAREFLSEIVTATPSPNGRREVTSLQPHQRAPSRARRGAQRRREQQRQRQRLQVPRQQHDSTQQLPGAVLCEAGQLPEAVQQAVEQGDAHEREATQRHQDQEAMQRQEQEAMQRREVMQEQEAVQEREAMHSERPLVQQPMRQPMPHPTTVQRPHAVQQAAISVPQGGQQASAEPLPAKRPLPTVAGSTKAPKMATGGGLFSPGADPASLRREHDSLAFLQRGAQSRESTSRTMRGIVAAAVGDALSGTPRKSRVSSAPRRLTDFSCE